MKKSKKIILIKIILILAIFFIAFILPILGMRNCSGWNEGSMAVTSCTIDGNIFREYANFYYGLLLISAFMMLIPAVIYVGVVIFFTKLILKLFDKTEQK